MTISFERRQINGWSYYCVPELERQDILHGFFTRESPNLLNENERKLFLDMFSMTDVVIMNQEHGDTVHTIGTGERPERGDGLILLQKNVAGVIKTADCMPVIIIDPIHPMAAIVHAGWRGTVQKIVEKAVMKMRELGARVDRMTALLGPSIRTCCYKIGADVEGDFKEKGFSNAIFRNDDQSIYLDLAQANRELLESHGIQDIRDAGLCTYCSKQAFASFRRGDHAARQISFVSVRG